MRRSGRRLGGVAAIVGVVAAAALGGASSAPSATGSSGTVTLLMGVFPQSLDPGLDYTTQGFETNWLVYTGLTSYAHAGGIGGTRLIPGLCSAMPAITDGGRTYTCTLRHGLVYSNGRAVKASDFLYTVERSIKLPWAGVGGFVLPNLEGAKAYAQGQSRTISGIQVNDTTGQITMHLTQPFGAWDNILAFPAYGLIPAGTPMRPQPTTPPPGVGPYVVKDIAVGRSFLDVANPYWARMAIPGIPAAKASVQVKVDANISANALAVAHNSADVFDWADPVPVNLTKELATQAKGRFRFVNPGGSTYYMFLNSTEAPFNNQLAREAVVTGLDENEMSRLDGGALAPACYFLPADIPGHPTAPCPYGTPGAGNLAKAKALVSQSGEAGASVTVWGEQRAPRLQWMKYYTSLLNAIGFHATLRTVPDVTYFTTIGQAKAVHPQTGFADWNQDYPNPLDFYDPLLDGHAITPTNNENFGQTNDPYVNSQLKSLAPTPTPELAKVAGRWRALDQYVAKKAYVAVFGSQEFAELTSNRLDSGGLEFNPLYGWDFTSFRVK